MKSTILTHSIAALLLAAPIARADEQKAGEKKHDGKSASASTSVVASGDGTATVTIDINGKKETRTFKLGDGNSAFSFSTDGDGATAAGGGGIGAPGQPLPLNAKRERGPWIGIAMEPVQEVVRAQLALGKGEGIVINHVAPESPAAKAGLAENDILLRFEDQIIVEPSQLRKLIAMKKSGDSVKLTYLRKGERKETSVTLVEHELEAGEHNQMQWLQMAPAMQGWQGKAGAAIQGLKGADGANVVERLQEQLKQLKEKHPGVVVDKRSWFSGPGAGDGHQPKVEELEQERARLDMLLDETGKLLDSPNKSLDKKPELRKQIEDQMAKRRKAIDEQLKALKHPRPDEDRKGDAPPKPADKKPGEPL